MGPIEARVVPPWIRCVSRPAAVAANVSFCAGSATTVIAIAASCAAPHLAPIRRRKPLDATRRVVLAASPWPNDKPAGVRRRK
jgi:hypothetical protein